MWLYGLHIVLKVWQHVNAGSDRIEDGLARQVIAQTVPPVQDTYLLATQQEVTLAAELAAHMASSAAKEGADRPSGSTVQESDGHSGHPTGATGLTRRRIFCHR